MRKYGVTEGGIFFKVTSNGGFSIILSEFLLFYKKFLEICATLNFTLKVLKFNFQYQNFVEIEIKNVG